MMFLCRAQRLTLSLFGCYVVALAVSFPLQLTTARETVLSLSSISSKTDPSLNCDNPVQQILEENQEIRNFLSGKDSREALSGFHVHGWRWHTLSLNRESGRLYNLAKRTTTASIDRLKKATEYVIDFNLKGLHKIEADLLFPWMKEKLSAIDSEGVGKEFASVMDQLEDNRKKVAELGNSIVSSVDIASDLSLDVQDRAEAIRDVAEASAALQTFTRRMIEIEDTIFVPAIAMTVSEAEQQSFNNRVLINLGIFDSRLHLVGMHEAVWEAGDPAERLLFKKAIPSIPQRMIPRWKRKLYDPETKFLDQ